MFFPTAFLIIVIFTLTVASLIFSILTLLDIVIISFIFVVVPFIALTNNRSELMMAKELFKLKITDSIIYWNGSNYNTNEIDEIKYVIKTKPKKGRKDYTPTPDQWHTIYFRDKDFDQIVLSYKKYNSKWIIDFMHELGKQIEISIVMIWQVTSKINRDKIMRSRTIIMYPDGRVEKEDWKKNY